MTGILAFGDYCLERNQPSDEPQKQSQTTKESGRSHIPCPILIIKGVNYFSNNLFANSSFSSAVISSIISDLDFEKVAELEKEISEIMDDMTAEEKEELANRLLGK